MESSELRPGPLGSYAWSSLRARPRIAVQPYGGMTIPGIVSLQFVDPNGRPCTYEGSETLISISAPVRIDGTPHPLGYSTAYSRDAICRALVGEQLVGVVMPHNFSIPLGAITQLGRQGYTVARFANDPEGHSGLFVLHQEVIAACFF